MKRLSTLLLLVQALSLAPIQNLARADDYATTCSGVATDDQKAAYCKSAKVAQEGAATNSLLTKVWAGVAGVCVAACAATYAGVAAADYVCMGANIGGGVTDAVQTKEYTGLATTVVGMGVSYAMKSSASTAAAAAAKAPVNGTPPSNGNMSSCLSGAAAGVQAFMKNQAAESAQQSATDNLTAANTLQTPGTNIPIFTPPADGGPTVRNTALINSNLPPPPPFGNRPTGGTRPPGALPGSGSSGPESGGFALIPHQDAPIGSNGTGGGPQPCASSDAQSQLSCAIASDRNLPSFVSDPRFQKELERLSGTNLGNFLKAKTSASQTLGSLLGGGADPTQRAKLDEAIGALQAKMSADQGGPAYAGGGAGGGAPAASEDPGLASLLSNLTSQLGGAEATTSSNDLLKFGDSLAESGRSPAGLASEEDRSLSIFFRVTQRYRLLAKRMTPAKPQLQVPH